MSGQTTNNSTTEQRRDFRAAAMSPIFKGRDTIYCDPVEINAGNIVQIVEQTMIKHESNRIEMRYLKEYEKGDQPIFYRVKEVRNNTSFW